MRIEVRESHDLVVYLVRMFPEILTGALLISFGLPYLLEPATFQWVLGVVGVVYVVHILFMWTVGKIRR